MSSSEGEGSRTVPCRRTRSPWLLFTMVLGGYTYFTDRDPTYRYHWGWVKANVPDSVWVGAGQSGVLGYFHDRTINTDGKVNTELYFVDYGHIGDYLADRGVDYFIEWGVSSVFKDSGFLERFVYVCDFGTNQIWRRSPD